MRISAFARVEHVARTGSTSTDLVKAAAAAPEQWPHLSVLLTDHQVAGRGRSGRAWETPPGAALTASILLRPLVAPDQLGWVTLLAGLALVRAIGDEGGARGRPGTPGPNRAAVLGSADDASGAPGTSRVPGAVSRSVVLGSADEASGAPGTSRVPGAVSRSAVPVVGLKWPNDVLVRGAGPDLAGWGTDRKIAGVLTEVVPVTAGRGPAVESTPSVGGRAAGTTSSGGGPVAGSHSPAGSAPAIGAASPAAPALAPDAQTAPDAASRAGCTAVVVGMGINLTQARADLPVPWATSLALAGLPVPEPVDLLERIGRELAALVRDWESAGDDLFAEKGEAEGAGHASSGGQSAGDVQSSGGGQSAGGSQSAGEGAPPAAVRAAVRAVCASIGREVRVDLPGGRTVTGMATDLDDHGHLVVRTGAGEVTVLAGDVVHLRSGPAAGPPA